MGCKKNHLEKEKLIDFHKIEAIIQKNFIVMSRNKARIIPLILFPIVMIMIFGFTSGNTPKHISTAIVIYDNSPFSQQIQQGISNSQVFTVRYLVSTEGEGKKLLDSGKVSVLIGIPSNLQEKIDNGELVGITVIVDESDSSLARTVKEAINAIIDSLSKDISIGKIVDFQQSVDPASKRLQNYNTQFANKYSLIVSKLKKAEDSLEDANKKINQQATTLENSLSPPTPVVFPKVKVNEAVFAINQTYIPEKPAYLLTKAQISVLEQSSDFIQVAKENVQSAREIAAGEDKKLKDILEYQYQKDNIIEPMSNIKDFTSHNPNSLLKPLVYEEKPAYGKGKRAIDFLIPSIIAMVIFQGAVLGMGRAVAGEKREGSLTRVFLTPTSNWTIILGTLSSYIIFEIFRSSFLILIAMSFFNIKIEGSLIAVFLIVIIYAGVSTAIGMLISSLAKSEDQYLAMSMLVSLPIIFLAGAFFPIEAMPKFLQTVTLFLPVTYAANALRGVMIKGLSLVTVFNDILILLFFLVLTVGAVFLVFRRDIE